MLELTDLSAGYGDRIVLNRVNFTIAPGERLSLIGHNGAGKSTILKAISGQIRPTSGEVRFGNERLNGLKPEAMVRRGIVQVPAGRRVFAQLTVQQNLEMGAFTRTKRKEVGDDLEQIMVQFPALRRKSAARAGTLSGGEQQMLAIARGLMARPKLFLVDEPSLGLSPLMVDEVFALLAELTNTSMSLVLAEQNVRKALATTSRAVVLSQGAVQIDMPSGQLLSDDHFRRAYLGGA